MHRRRKYLPAILSGEMEATREGGGGGGESYLSPAKRGNISVTLLHLAE